MLNNSEFKIKIWNHFERDMSIPLTYRIVEFCLDPAASEGFAALAQYLDQSGDSDDLADLLAYSY